MRLSAMFVVSSVVVLCAACAPIEGQWSGKTSSCQNADNDKVPVTIVVTDGKASLTTSLGVVAEGAFATQSEGGTLEDPYKLAFETKVNSDSTTITYAVDLTAADDGASHSGTIEVAVNGAGKTSCELTVTR